MKWNYLYFFHPQIFSSKFLFPNSISCISLQLRSKFTVTKRSDFTVSTSNKFRSLVHWTLAKEKTRSTKAFETGIFKIFRFFFEKNFNIPRGWRWLFCREFWENLLRGIPDSIFLLPRVQKITHSEFLSICYSIAWPHQIIHLIPPNQGKFALLV